MRKLLIILGLIASLVLCYYVVTNGLTIGEVLNVADFKQVGTASKQVDTLISQLVNLNETSFKAKKAEVNSAITEYKNQKEQYESMKAATMTPTETQDVGMVDMYDIDFLWTIIGSYGTEEGINLKMDCVKSTVFPEINEAEYTMCDLRFTVSGDYIAITEFIYHIEDDSRLGFEISSFEMTKGGENLQATFVIRGVPVNNKNLSQLQVSIDSSANANTNTTATNTTTDSSVKQATSNALEQTGASLSGGKLRDTNTTSNTTASTNTVSGT